MKKVLIIVLLAWLVPVASSAQWEIENAKRDSANVKLMLSNGYCRQTSYTINQGTRKQLSDLEYDVLGNVIRNRMYKNGIKVETDSAGRKANVFYYSTSDSAKLDHWIAFEYDKANHITKRANYGNISSDKNDSANLVSWSIHEYDSAGRILKVTSHGKRGSGMYSSYAYVSSADDRWTYTYSYSNNRVTNKHASRVHHEGTNFWTHDLIVYGGDDSIINLVSDYYQYDAQGRVIESGNINYGYITSWADYQMAVDGKLKGGREVEYRYQYDTLDRVSRILNNDNVLVYLYNKKNQVAEVIYHFSDPYPGESKISLYIKFEYDANGLLIRETRESPASEPPSVIYYEYIRCQ